MGVPAKAAGAPIASPTASLTIDDLVGDPLPGRTQEGFLGGTGIVVGTTTTGDDDYSVDASSVTVEVAENVLVGEVTENTLQGETFDSGGSFKVQGVDIRPTNDERIPFSAGVAGLPVDMSTVDMGTLAGPEGHIGNDGVLYAHTLEVEGELVEGDHTSILRVRCADGGRLEIRGASSSQTGSVTVYDDSTGAALGTAAIEPDAELGIGTYRFRQDISVCPMVVRIENTNGSSALATITGAPVPGEEPEPEEPPEDPGATVQTLAIQGSGERASYEFIVDGEVTGLDLTSEDRVVDGERAIGAVGAGTDHYEFTGTLLSVEVNGPATVTLDGEPYPIDQPLDNTLSIRGNDNRASYSFSVSGDLAGSDRLTGEDTIDGASATGAVRRGQDTYYYSGDVTAFEFTQGAATIIRNGQVVTDPTQP